MTSSSRVTVMVENKAEAVKIGVVQILLIYCTYLQTCH